MESSDAGSLTKRRAGRAQDAPSVLPIATDMKLSDTDNPKTGDFFSPGYKAMLEVFADQPSFAEHAATLDHTVDPPSDSVAACTSTHSNKRRGSINLFPLTRRFTAPSKLFKRPPVWRRQERDKDDQVFWDEVTDSTKTSMTHDVCALGESAVSDHTKQIRCAHNDQGLIGERPKGPA